MQDLKALKTQKKTGAEKFHIDGKRLNISLLNFWQWSSSEIVGNALRGMLAEFIVANALGRAEDVRVEWDAYDVLTPDGTKVEVKSGAYVQSWSQSNFSKINFGIQPTFGWDSKAESRSTNKLRQADVYVFCVLTCKDKVQVDPLNLSQWTFYVLATRVLDEKLGNQKTLSLRTLKSLKPLIVDYQGIADAVATVSSLET